MTTSKVIAIHEFSTGIQAQRTNNGSWESQGFTGQYMNVTLDPIPQVVRKAISNRLFAVAEGLSKEQPAIIGREVTEGEETWSVIAVVSKGKDDRGRSASMYRYFLSEGANQLTPILRWMFTKKKNYVFNPFDYQEIGEPHQANVDRTSPPLKNELVDFLTNSTPIILPADKSCSSLIINSLAEQKSKENNYPIAWAYKVEALEKPHSFQVIHPASTEAEQLLVKKISSPSKTPVFIENEQDLNTAIKAVFRKGKIEPEQLSRLEDGLNNSQITEDYWQKLFDGQGANKALQQGIYSAPMVRLLALQAVILPATLPKYLGWLEKREKNEEAKKIFIEFQKQVRQLLARTNPESEFSALKQKVIQGVRLLIPSVIKQPNLLTSTISLLKPQNGLWGYFYHYQVKKEIENDLKTAPQSIPGYQPDAVLTLVESEPLWEEVFQDIQSVWKRSRIPRKEKYLPLAEFFEQVSYFNASALFYHIAWGEVPGEVFKSCQGRRNRYYRKIYGIAVKRHISLFEKVWNELVEVGGIIVPVYIFAPLLALSFILGGFILPRSPLVSAVFDPKTKEETSKTNVATDTNSQTTKTSQTSEQKGEEKENTSQTTSQEKSQNTQAKNQSQLILEPAVENDFDNKTRESIQKIINDKKLFTSEDSTILDKAINKDFSIQENRIHILRTEVFNNDSLQASVILKEEKPINISESEWEKWKKNWVSAIEQYQKRKLNYNQPDGIITPGKATHKQIKDQLNKRKEKIVSDKADIQ